MLWDHGTVEESSEGNIVGAVILFDLFGNYLGTFIVNNYFICGVQGEGQFGQVGLDVSVATFIELFDQIFFPAIRFNGSGIQKDFDQSGR